MLAKCDECAAEFEIENFEETTTKDYTKTSFFCPACGREYIAFAKNNSIKKKQAEVKKMYAQVRKPGTSYAEQKKLMLGIKKKEKAVKAEMNALKQSLI
jgi:predicted RNA-binding Zn-ribbon protein involved in translation (DUF1610 family)